LRVRVGLGEVLDFFGVQHLRGGAEHAATIRGGGRGGGRVGGGLFWPRRGAWGVIFVLAFLERVGALVRGAGLLLSQERLQRRNRGLRQFGNEARVPIVVRISLRLQHVLFVRGDQRIRRRGVLKSCHRDQHFVNLAAALFHLGVAERLEQRIRGGVAGATRGM